MKTLVIMNEQHKLFPYQKHILDSNFGNWEPILVPSEGWPLEKQILFCSEELEGIKGVVFVSPIPYVLARLSYMSGQGYPIAVYVFVNDERAKKELPDGQIIQALSPDGWQLIVI